MIMIIAFYADKGQERVEHLAMKKKEDVGQLTKSFSPKKKPKLGQSQKQLQVRDKGTGHGNNTNNILALAEESLPAILSSSRSLTTRILNEIKRHHRWFGVICHYSVKLSRLLRVVSLATNIIIMLFVQSLTYDLTNGNDGICERLSSSEESCLAPKSAFATGTSKCYWIPSDSSSSYASSSVDGTCHFLQPDNSIEVVLFVAIFSALISTPIALFADRVIIYVLAAPTIHTLLSSASSSSPIAAVLRAGHKQKKSRVTDAPTFENAISVVPKTENQLMVAEKIGKADQQRRLLKAALLKFSHLTKEIKEYRDLFTDVNDKAEFDGK
jgi:hypothetical protein